MALHPTKKSLWLKAYQIENQYGSHQNVINLLEHGKEQHEFLRLLLAKTLYKMQQNDKAEQVLLDGLKAADDGEDFILALQKMYR